MKKKLIKKGLEGLTVPRLRPDLLYPGSIYHFDPLYYKDFGIGNHPDFDEDFLSRYGLRYVPYNEVDFDNKAPDDYRLSNLNNVTIWGFQHENPNGKLLVGPDNKLITQKELTRLSNLYRYDNSLSLISKYMSAGEEPIKPLHPEFWLLTGGAHALQKGLEKGIASAVVDPMMNMEVVDGVIANTSPYSSWGNLASSAFGGPEWAWELVHPAFAKDIFKLAQAGIRNASKLLKPKADNLALSYGISSDPVSGLLTLEGIFSDPVVLDDYKNKLIKILDKYHIDSNPIKAARTFKELTAALPNPSTIPFPIALGLHHDMRVEGLLLEDFYEAKMKQLYDDWIKAYGDPIQEGMNRVKARYENGGRERLQLALDESYEEMLKDNDLVNEAVNVGNDLEKMPIMDQERELISRAESGDIGGLIADRPPLSGVLFTGGSPVDVTVTDIFTKTPTIDFLKQTHAATPNDAINNIIEFAKRIVKGDRMKKIPASGEVSINPTEILDNVTDASHLYTSIEDATSHEVGHILMPTARTKPKGFDFSSLSFSDAMYFIKGGYSELAARGTQIKNYLERLGIWHEGMPITEDMLRKVAAEYTKFNADNQMTAFFNAITNWKDAAEWITKFAPAAAGAGVVGKVFSNSNNSIE